MALEACTEALILKAEYSGRLSFIMISLADDLIKSTGSIQAAVTKAYETNTHAHNCLRQFSELPEVTQNIDETKFIGLAIRDYLPSYYALRGIYDAMKNGEPVYRQIFAETLKQVVVHQKGIEIALGEVFHHDINSMLGLS